MLETELVHPSKLSRRDRDAWASICAAVPEFGSPLFAPVFAEIVGRVRTDATVAVFRRHGRPTGFLPHHRSSTGLGRPIGAPFSDYNALISEPDCGLNGAEALAAAGLTAFKFSALIDPHCLFADIGGSSHEAHVIELTTTAEDHLEAIRARSPKRFKNLRRLDHKLARECGKVSFVAPDRSLEALELLQQWKRDQLKRTGLHDFLGPVWARALMQGAFERQGGDFRGLLLTLRVNGRPVAGQFGVRLGDRFHPWLAAFDPAFTEWSVGQLFFMHAIAAMPSLGLTVYDLGQGHDHYKAAFAAKQVSVTEGMAFAPTTAGALARSWEGAWSLAGRAMGQRSGVLTSARRRLDHIAAVETSISGRLKGVFDAAAGLSRRRGQRLPSWGQAITGALLGS